MGDERFFIQHAWTDSLYRRQGFITALYVALNRRLRLTLISDVQQGPSMMKVWDSLPLQVKVWDRETNEVLSRNQVPNEKVYNDENPGRYLLIIENNYSDHPDRGILYENDQFINVKEMNL